MKSKTIHALFVGLCILSLGLIVAGHSFLTAESHIPAITQTYRVQDSLVLAGTQGQANAAVEDDTYLPCQEEESTVAYYGNGSGYIGLRFAGFLMKKILSLYL